MNTVFKQRERKSNLIIVCANQKGGVGKTSLCASLCNHYAEIRHKFCAVDTDAQRSLWKLREENKQKTFAMWTVMSSSMPPAVSPSPA